MYCLYLSIYPSIHPSIHKLCLSLYVCLYLCVWVCPYVRMSVYLSVCLYVCLSACRYACMHACMHILHYITSHYNTIALHCIALHCIPFRSIALHCSTVHAKISINAYITRDTPWCMALKPPRGAHFLKKPPEVVLLGLVFWRLHEVEWWRWMFPWFRQLFLHVPITLYLRDSTSISPANVWFLQ